MTDTRPINLSFIIPAWNEQALIGATINSIHDAATECGIAFEIIVASDGSTDDTAKIARDLGATVVEVEFRQISRTRNAGAAIATGARFVFVDADTTISAETVRQTIAAFEAGCIGGGAMPRFEGHVPFWGKCLLYGLLVPLFTLARLVAGCYIFASREAFESTGGFDDNMFAGEEVDLAWKLKKQGRFKLIRERVTTSGRKLRDYSFIQVMRPLWKGAWKGRKYARSREGFELWYGNPRNDG
jgi:glycosyltransferase involved in cell wall biosynthesis